MRRNFAASPLNIALDSCSEKNCERAKSLSVSALLLFTLAKKAARLGMKPKTSF